jgi:hypothetical protein
MFQRKVLPQSSVQKTSSANNQQEESRAALKMEAYFSQISVNLYQTTWHLTLGDNCTAYSSIKIIGSETKYTTKILSYMTVLGNMITV